MDTKALKSKFKVGDKVVPLCGNKFYHEFVGKTGVVIEVYDRGVTFQMPCGSRQGYHNSWGPILELDVICRSPLWEALK